MLKQHVNLTDIDHFNVCTVDGYQGEENDVILLSLVRSNMPRTIGFLDNRNRFVVALSRARRGLYIFGNSVTLTTSESEDPHRGRQPLWLPLIQHLGSKKRFNIDDGLPLTCSRHSNITIVHEAADIDKLAGGCRKKCDMGRLPCNHECPLKCHPFEHDEVNCCQELCTKTLACGHMCSVTCNAQCFCETCDLRDDDALETEIPQTNSRSSDPALKRSENFTDQRNRIDQVDSGSPMIHENEMATWKDSSSYFDRSSNIMLRGDNPTSFESGSNRSNLISTKANHTWAKWDAKKADSQMMLESMKNGASNLENSTRVFDDSHKQITVRNGVRTISKHVSRLVLEDDLKPKNSECPDFRNTNISGHCSHESPEKEFSLIDGAYPEPSKLFQGSSIEINECGNSTNGKKNKSTQSSRDRGSTRKNPTLKATKKEKKTSLHSLI